MKTTPKPNKTAKAKVSTKPGKSTVARSGSSKNRQVAEKKAKTAIPRVKAGTSRAVSTARKAIFVEAYIANGCNATGAALAAGYSAKSASVTGCNLLKEPKIAADIAERTQKVAEKFGLTTERTLMEIARLAYSDPRKFYRPDGSLKLVSELDDDTAATIASVEVDELREGGAVVGNTVKVKQWDKNAALEKAMKFHGLYERDNKQQPSPTIILMEQITTSPNSRIKVK